jgi:hypothetical protein
MTSPVQFSGQFELLLVSDSIWEHCDLSIVVSETAEGAVANACHVYDGPVRRKNRTLQAGEIRQLRALLRQADLFGKMSEGTDHRGIDLPLITLKATADGRTTEVVCYMNPAFQREGHRKRLLDHLMTLYRETREARALAHVPPNDNAADEARVP